MEYQGIITGISDENHTNLITPEIDATLYKYILGKNAIIKGLEIIDNGDNTYSLSSGMCVLLGYRGILKNTIANISGDYIYGKFTLNFDNEIEDTFEIEESNTWYTTPTQINQAGTYRLMLYQWATDHYETELSAYNYPLRAYSSDESWLLNGQGIISEGALTYTYPVNEHTRGPGAERHIASTLYVHNQIEEEIEYEIINLDITVTVAGVTTKIGDLILKKKSKYCIATMQFNFNNITPAMLDPSWDPVYNWGTIPLKFYPKNKTYFSLQLLASATSINVDKLFLMAIETTGQFTIQEYRYNGGVFGTFVGAPQTNIGYETN